MSDSSGAGEHTATEATSAPRTVSRQREIAAIALGAVSILALISLTSDAAGMVGEYTAAGLRAFAGQAALLVPVFALGVAILGFRTGLGPGRWRRAGGLGLLFVILTIGVHLLHFLPSLPEVWMWQDQLYIGLDGGGGGVFGALITTALMVAFGLSGTGVILAAAWLVALVLIFDMSWAEFLGLIWKGMTRAIAAVVGWIWRTLRIGAEDVIVGARRSWERRQLRSMRHRHATDSDDSWWSERDSAVEGDSFAPPFRRRVREGDPNEPDPSSVYSAAPDVAAASAEAMPYEDGSMEHSSVMRLGENGASDGLATVSPQGGPGGRSAGDAVRNAPAGHGGTVSSQTAAGQSGSAGAGDPGKEHEQKEPHLRLRDWRSANRFRMPPPSLLELPRPSKRRSAKREPDRSERLEKTLASFGVEANVVNVSQGPVITRYELQPAPGVKVSKITSLVDDLSLSLATAGLRIEAPVPGKAVVGIEVPNQNVTPVYLREVLDSEAYQQASSPLSMALGKDIAGQPVVADLRKILHLLIAGATGSGKSVCINSIIVSLLYKARPTEVKFIMIDPKRVELAIYDGIPHLMAPVVTDPRQAAGALRWAVKEMERRYELISEAGARHIDGYNAYIARRGDLNAEVLPYLVVIIDELADLMMVAAADVEDAICRLAQMARAAGIYLIVATQRPSVDVITGLIKANVPSRVSFAVSSQVDSRTILDMAGAERLLGKGDMLFHPLGSGKPQRVQGAFIGDREVEDVVAYWKAQGTPDYDHAVFEVEESVGPDAAEPDDELFDDAVRLVREQGQASVSMIQRRFRVGYSRAARLIDMMEMRGIVGPYQGSKPREVLMYHSSNDP